MTEINQTTIFENDPDSSAYEHKQSIDQLQEKFSDFGLTNIQCKVYIFLGKYGSKTAPEVCRALKLPRTETYHNNCNQWQGHMVHQCQNIAWFRWQN